MASDRSSLARRVYASHSRSLEWANETFEADGARFVRNRDHPNIFDANHVSHATCESERDIERLFARVEREYAHCPHRRFDVDPWTPPAFVARLTLDGYVADEDLLLVLEGELQARPAPCDIRRVETEEQWAGSAALHELDWLERWKRLGRTPEPSVPGAFAALRRKSPPDVAYWMAYHDGMPVAYAWSWQGVDGVGVVEDLFTHPDYRHRGIATALIAHGVADARARGAGPVIISADPGDTPKHMYRALGFRPIVVVRHYVRRLSD